MTPRRAQQSRPDREIGSSRKSARAVRSPVRFPYFVTGPYARTAEWSSATNIRWAHAKEVGRSVTLCGLPTGSWVTLWEVPFYAQSLQGACPICRLAADGESPQ